MLPDDVRDQLLEADAADPREVALAARAERLRANAPPQQGLIGVIAPRRFRLRGRDASDVPIMCFGFVFIFSLIVWMFMCQALEPNQFGILKNKVTGVVDPSTIRGGLRFTGPFSSYVTFPATQVTLSFWQGGDRMPIMARTGQDVSDSDDESSSGGGQPIQISCAFQFQIVPAHLRQIYLSFGSYYAAEQRWLLLSGNMVSNVAQQFTPQDFWTNRRQITDRMLRAINETLWTNGHITVTKFQIKQIDFNSRFEESIVGVQVAEQQRVVNEYSQQTETVVQAIAVLSAENDAIIANISAGAVAASREMVARANRDAFNLKQNMKADKYTELQQTLNFDRAHMNQYFKIKALQAQGATGELVVGMPNIGTGSQPPHVDL